MVGDQEMSSESLKPFGTVEAKLCCLQIETKITFRKTQANFGLRLQKIQLQSLVVVCISHSCTKPVLVVRNQFSHMYFATSDNDY